MVQQPNETRGRVRLQKSGSNHPVACNACVRSKGDRKVNSLVGIYLVVAMVCAVIAGYLAGKKHRDALGFAIVGFLFGPIGVLVAAVVGAGQPPAPEGFVAVTCPRCNTRQNVNKESITFECYQCKCSTRVMEAGGDRILG